METDEVARLFNDSYERVMHGPAEKNEEFFTAAQIRMLQASVAVLLAFFASGRQDAYLAKLAERHGKQGADITPELYSVWLDCLVSTVRQFDPKFNDDVATAWREVFSKGIEFMTSRY